MSYIGVLAGQYHLSVRKIQTLLKEQLGTTFSVGAISEAQTKVASMLTPLHQAIKQALKKAPLVHADETSHHRNDETSLRWCWLVASDDLVYEQILYSRSTSSAKKVIDEDYAGIVVSDQCPSYNWITGYPQTVISYAGRMLSATFNKWRIIVAVATPLILANIFVC